MVKISKKENAAKWITENETDLHQFIYDNRNNPRRIAPILKKIKREGTAHQYVAAFDYAKEVTK